MNTNNFYKSHLQKHTKPKIEDVIPYYLEGDLKEIMIDFAVYACANKMPIKWASANRWKAMYKNKIIFWICLPESPDSHYKHICPCLNHLNMYEDTIKNEGLQNYIWDNVKICRNVLYGSCNSHGTAPGHNEKILGKDFENVCHQNKYFAVYNPNETDIDCIKRLLELEKQARDTMHFANKTKLMNG